MAMSPLHAVIAALGVYAAVIVGCGTEENAEVPNPSSTEAGHAPVPVDRVARPPSRGSGQRWVPAPATTWQWQLTTPVDTGVDAQVYDIDGTENGVDIVRELHTKGRKVICYVNAGAAESFRPDYPSFPASALGKNNGWPGERWLDIRQRDTLRPIMAARFDMCMQKGFDAVEADLVDGYQNDTGFHLTAQDQLAYNRMLAELVHQRGMSIGLKNDLDQVADLIGEFEFAVNEQCVEYGECQKLAGFIRAGKAVFHTEYNLKNDDFCPQAKANQFSSMRKNLKLDAGRWPC